MTELLAGGNGLPTSNKSEPLEFHARIDEVVLAIGSSELAASLTDVSEASVARWRKGPTMPPFDKVAALCRAAGFRVEWLASGEGPRRTQPWDALTDEGTHREHQGGGAMRTLSPTGPDTDMVLLPRLGVEASAGLGLVPNAEEVDSFVALSKNFLRQIGVDPAHAHVLQVSGRSMVPTINDKDVVVIDTSKTRVLNEGIYTLVYGEAVLVKRIEMLRDGGINIVSDNKNEGYRDEYVSRSEMSTVRIVGQVKGQVRPL